MEPVRSANRVVMACRRDVREEISGQRAYLSLAVDHPWKTVDFRLDTRRDVAAAKTFLRKPVIDPDDYHIGRVAGR